MKKGRKYVFNNVGCDKLSGGDFLDLQAYFSAPNTCNGRGKDKQLSVITFPRLKTFKLPLMRRTAKFLATALLIISGHMAAAQDVGVSFSFFFPRNGEFSVPISPFSYRGLALPFSDYMGIQTGASMYIMPGLSIKELPFESKKSLYGPNITAYVPLELYLQFSSGDVTFTLKGGAFGFYSLLTHLNYGNLDRAIRDHEQWSVANAEFDYRKLPGWGYQFGIETLVQVNRKMGITFEVNYLNGSSILNMTGQYSGVDANGVFQTVQADFPGSAVDFSGIEISLGAVFGN